MGPNWAPSGQTMWAPLGIYMGLHPGSKWVPLGIYMGPHLGPKWAIWAPLGIYMGPTWDSPGIYMGPTWDLHGPHLGPTWAPLAPETTWAPLGPHLGSKWAPSGQPTHISFDLISSSTTLYSSILCYFWIQWCLHFYLPCC